MKLEFSKHIFEIFQNIKSHENPSSKTRVFHAKRHTHRGRDRQADRRTDRMTALIIVFRDFTNAPKTFAFYTQNVLITSAEYSQ